MSFPKLSNNAEDFYTTNFLNNFGLKLFFRKTNIGRFLYPIFATKFFLRLINIILFSNNNVSIFLIEGRVYKFRAEMLKVLIVKNLKNNEHNKSEGDKKLSCL